jgi:hypothetical protein
VDLSPETLSMLASLPPDRRGAVLRIAAQALASRLAQEDRRDACAPAVASSDGQTAFGGTNGGSRPRMGGS